MQIDDQGLISLPFIGATKAAGVTTVVFDRAGNFVRSWGALFFGGAHGFDLVVEDGREILYLTDLQQGLFKMTLDGELIWHVAKPDWYEGKDLKYRPSNVAVAPGGGRVFVTGTQRTSLIFSPRIVITRAFGA